MQAAREQLQVLRVRLPELSLSAKQLEQSTELLHLEEAEAQQALSLEQRELRVKEELLKQLSELHKAPERLPELFEDTREWMPQ